MRTSIGIAALLVSSGLFVGCDKTSSTTTTPPPSTPQTMTPQTMTPQTMTPATPDTSKTTSAINGAIDKGADAMKKANDKMSGAIPTTKPAMPDMPAMPQ